MREDRDDGLTGALGRATDGLRAEPTMRAEWRDEVLRQVQAARAPSARLAKPFRLSVSIPWAIAAGLVCALVGAGVARMIPAAAVRAQAEAGAPVVLPVKFSVAAPNAARVSIVGDFNEWNPTSLPMKRSSDGRLWEVEVRLPLGRYSYAFMIDGRLALDPAAPRSAGDDFGTPNSVLMVRGS
jgi:Carbohydrate-binding module 48 (Isoamylase N-terminal domain)